jgi:GH35 family endo-1,4-beta-xylanase
MKRIIVTFLLASAYVATLAQTSFPKYQKDDKDHTMSDAYWKLWNPEVQAKIDADIDANRKADACITLNVPTGTEVKIEQVTHDFIFGAHIFNYNQLGTHERNERYKELYGTLFNSATIAFYWKKFEMEPGRLRFNTEYWDTEEYWNRCKDPKMQPHWRRPSADQVVEFCKSKGIRLHGHTIIWGNRTWQHPHWIIEDLMTPEEKARMDTYVSEYINPKNLQAIEKYTDTYNALTNDQLSDALPEYTKTLNELFENRIKTLAEHYGGTIDSWDVVNESSTDFKKMNPGGRLIKSNYGIMPADYTYKAFLTAQKVFPNKVKLNINDYNMEQDYLDQVNDLTARGCKIDIMGAQMHLFDPQQCQDIAAGAEIQTPDQVWGWSDLLGKAGKPIHLSEITITSPGDDAHGRQIQAIIAQNLYRLWFSIKPMMGITWWNVVDDCGAPGEPSVSGLFDRDMKPKASYYALDNLINHEWKTNLTVKTGKKGVIHFRGFKGNYKVSWTDKDGNMVTKEFYLKDDGDGLTL